MNIVKKLTVILFVMSSFSMSAATKESVDYGLIINNASEISSMEFASLANYLQTGGGISSVTCRGAINLITTSKRGDSIQIWGAMSCSRFSLEDGFSKMTKKETEKHIEDKIKSKVEDMLGGTDYELVLNVRPRPSIGASN